jgi:hypothetical protein
MKRVLAVAALAVAAVPLLATAPASAATSPSACLHVDISINGTGQAQDICLPPSGSLF